MAKPDVKGLIRAIHAANPNFDTQWLEDWLGTLNDKEQAAAMKNIQHQASLGNWGDLIRPAQEEVRAIRVASGDAQYKPPGDALLQALHLTKEDWSKLNDEQMAAIHQIGDHLDTVEQDQRDSFLSQLSAKVPDYQNPILGMGFRKIPSADDLKSLLSGMQAQTGTTQDIHTQQLASNMDPTQVQVGATAITEDQKKAYEAITGQNFDTAYRHFTDNFAVALRTYNSATGQFQGGDQLWEGGAFNQMQTGQQFSGARSTAGMSDSDKQKYKVSEAQFLAQQGGTGVTLAAMIDKTLSTQWAAQHGGEQPPEELKTKIYEKIRNMDPVTLAQFYQSGGWQNAAQALMASGGAVDDVIQEYVSAHGGATRDHKELDATFISATGHGASAQDIEALKGADDETVKRYIENLPSKIPGITVGMHKRATAVMDKLWQDNFNKAPTDQEVSHFAGWPAQDIERWVNDQPYPSNPKMTVGQYNTYKSTVDRISQDLYGTSADDRLLGHVVGHFNQ